jgi:serine protease SohB
MACVADKIVAAPFAIIGSIGVIAQIPNVHRLLKKNNIDFEQLTAGEFKRTLTVFGENTEKARDKMQEEIEEVHQLFKDFIHNHRSQIDLDQVATGEHWLASQAFDLRLCDKLAASDDYLYEQCQTANVYEVSYAQKPTLSQKVLNQAQSYWQQLFSIWH